VETNPDIFCLNEIFLSDQDATPNFSDYSVHVNNRHNPHKRSGGVPVGIKSNILIDKV
jgi:hypothetical protein